MDGPPSRRPPTLTESQEPLYPTLPVTVPTVTDPRVSIYGFNVYGGGSPRTPPIPGSPLASMAPTAPSFDDTPPSRPPPSVSPYAIDYEVDTPPPTRKPPSPGLVSQPSAPVLPTHNDEDDHDEEAIKAYRKSMYHGPVMSGLNFSTLKRAPALSIPEGKGITRYDYTKAKSEPFSFAVDVQVEAPEVPESIEIEDSVEAIEEPPYGIEPEYVDIELLTKTRLSLPFVSYRPIYFKFPDEVPPLPPPNQFGADEKIDGIDALESGKGNIDAVRYVRVIDTTLQKKQKASIAKNLMTYKYTQVLILRGLSLENKDLAGIQLQDLRYCDISQNALQDLTPILEFLRKANYLEILIIAGNPVCSKPALRERIIAACPNLKRINDKDIDVDERLNSMTSQGSKSQKKNIDFVRWDLTVAVLPELAKMTTWQPEQITKLLLPNAKLTAFHIGSLVSLEELDLSHNMIVNLLGSGIEQCVNLVRANLSYNKIVKKQNLRVFEFTSRLLYLNLEGNRDMVSNKELSNYRSIVIYVTRNIKGTNRSLGLQDLDGSPISMEERIQAVSLHGRKRNEASSLRWYLSLIDYYGHQQMRLPNFLSHVKHLKLPSSNLGYVDLRGLFSIEVLDLSGNFLQMIDGLKELPKLRFLNLSGNPRLKLGAILETLKESTRLEQVSFGVKEEGHKLFHESRKYRDKVLTSLLLHNTRLKFIDNKYITLEERVSTLAMMPGNSKEQAEKYRFELALVMNCTVQNESRNFHYSEVVIGMQYNPGSITSLRRMNNRNLTWCDFRMFVNLEELNLSNNKLTDITTMGLDELKKLRVLDVSNNSIQTPLRELAYFIDKLKALECIALRGNPIMKSDSDRKKLIGLMNNMKEIDCTLQVIDTLVTTDERLDAWKAMGGHSEQVELMRYKAIMYQRIRGVDPATLTTLDLNEAGFAKIDVRKFVNLEVLLIRGNKLTTLEDTGVHSLTKLNVLDVRDNAVVRLEEFVDISRCLTALTTLGLGGNKCTDGKNWRIKFLGLLPELHEKPCALHRLDDQDIEVDEIVQAWKASNKDPSVDPRNFHFHVLMLLKIPQGVDPAQIPELDFSNSSISSIDLQKYPNLVKISVSNNDLRTLEGSNIRKLQYLEGLDLRKNKIKDLDQVIDEIRDLKSLSALFIDENPCFPSDDTENRLKFLSKFLTLVDPISNPLQFLNGKKITAKEKCRAIKRMKTAPFNAEQTKFAIIFKEKNITPEDTYLDISGYELSSIAGLHQLLPKLTHLQVNNNELRSLEVDVFSKLTGLIYLDISNNMISSMQNILDTLLYCKSLETLVMANATKSKETAVPREYAFKVCRVLRSLATVDGLKNPFGTLTVRPKRKEVSQMRIAESGFSDDMERQDEMSESPKEIAPISAVSTSPAASPNNNNRQSRGSGYLYDLPASIYKDIEQPGYETTWESLYKPRAESIIEPPSMSFTSYSANSSMYQYG